MVKYQNIYNWLIEEIKSGKFIVGQQFYTETEIAKKEKVTNFTVRNAFRLLENQGYIIRHRGKGTFIKSLRGAGKKFEKEENVARPWVYFYAQGSRAEVEPELFAPFFERYPNQNFPLRRMPQNVISYLLGTEFSKTVYFFEFNHPDPFLNNNLLNSLNFIPQHLTVNFDQERVLRQDDTPLSPIVAFPIRYVNRLPLVNLTLAQKIGLNIKKLPTTWDEIEEWCEFATRKKIKYPTLGIGPVRDFSCHYMFPSYLSVALGNERQACTRKQLFEKPFLKTVSFYKRLFGKYGLPLNSRDKNHFTTGKFLFSLFEGPWYTFEHKQEKCDFKYQVLEQMVPVKGASNFMYTSTNYLGVNYSGQAFSNPEKTIICNFFEFVCSEDFQSKIFRARNNNPCQSPHRIIREKHIKKCPEMEPFYYNNYLPVHQHAIQSFSSWSMVMPEIHEYFDNNISLDNLWEKVSWQLKRSGIGLEKITDLKTTSE